MKYGDVRLADEQQFSVYNFEMADVESAWQHFDLYENRMQGLLEKYAALAEENSRRSDGDEASRKSRFPLLGGLRPLPEVLAPVQHSRRAWSDFGH